MGKCETCLLELLDGTLVDTTALVDQVTGRGRLAGIDVADNDDVDVNLLLLTVMLSVDCSLDHIEGSGCFMPDCERIASRRSHRAEPLEGREEAGLTPW
jgi:hypothetical protein